MQFVMYANTVTCLVLSVFSMHADIFHIYTLAFLMHADEAFKYFGSNTQIRKAKPFYSPGRNTL